MEGDLEMAGTLPCTVAGAEVAGVWANLELSLCGIWGRKQLQEGTFTTVPVTKKRTMCSPQAGLLNFNQDS
ncbi:hypothetical protein EBX31_00855 [bacterium]|nr:hypothetical protein [bacterium]